MPTLTPLQRKALFKAAVVLHQITVAEAAAQFGVSYNHLTLVLAGERRASLRLQDAIAAFVDRPREKLFADSLSKRQRPIKGSANE